MNIVVGILIVCFSLLIIYSTMFTYREGLDCSADPTIDRLKDTVGKQGTLLDKLQSELTKMREDMEKYKMEADESMGQLTTTETSNEVNDLAANVY